MSAKKKPTEATPLQGEAYSGKAYAIIKDSYVLSRGIEFEIVDGKVVSQTVIASPDLPASSIGGITSAIWKQLRSQ